MRWLLDGLFLLAWSVVLVFLTLLAVRSYHRRHAASNIPRVNDSPPVASQGWQWLMHAFPLGWLLCDHQLRIIASNDAVRRFFPRLSTSQQKISLIELTHSLELQNLAKRSLQYVQEERVKLQLYGQDALCQVQLIPTPPSKPCGALLAVFYDTSYLHQLKQQRDDFIAEFCHQLNNPIATIISGIELFDSAKEESRTQEISAKVLPLIRRQLDRLNHLVRQLIDLSKMQDPATLEWQTIHSSQLLEKLVLDFQLALEQKGIRTSVEVQAATFAADHHRLMQALANLLDNAIKYSPRDSTITLRCRCKKNWVKLSVQDQGPGLSLIEQQLIRRRFYRVNQDQKGHGLGLCISEGVARAHGGKLLLESKPQQGTTFTLQLPFQRGTTVPAPAGEPVPPPP